MSFLKVAACFSMVLLSIQAFSQSRDFTVCKSNQTSVKILEMRVIRSFDIQTRFVAPKKAFRCSFLMLNNLAKAAEVIQDKEAFQCIESLLVYLQATPEKRISELVSSVEVGDHSSSIVLHKNH